MLNYETQNLIIIIGHKELTVSNTISKECMPKLLATHSMCLIYSQDLASPEAEPTYPLFVAKYDYKSETVKAMSFSKGDKLYIINDDDKDWWFARAKGSGQEGCVPSSYVAESNSLEAEE